MDMIKLLEGGQEAFPEIIENIRNAKKSIVIHMFIWRDDDVGNELAQELLNAADRGVKVEIVKDLYGSSCEYGEESGKSFFHRELGKMDKVKATALRLGYHPKMIAKKLKGDRTKLYREFMVHPNIDVYFEEHLYDHSKYYIFDDEVLIMGGINVEDKELGVDMDGREYKDFMISFRSETVCGNFKEYMLGKKANGRFLFSGNLPKEGRYEIKGDLLDMMDEAQEELTIIMPYISEHKEVLDRIKGAVLRGVGVTMVLPRSANYFDASNKRTLEVLLKDLRKEFGEKFTEGTVPSCKFEIRLSPKMVHAKIVATEKRIALGSCNLNRWSLEGLGELDAILPVEREEFPEGISFDNYHDFLRDFCKVKEAILEESKLAGEKDLKYNPISLAMERMSFGAERKNP